MYMSEDIKGMGYRMLHLSSGEGSELANTMEMCGFCVTQLLFSDFESKIVVSDMPDVIVIDERIPGEQAFSALRHIKFHGLLSDVPVFFFMNSGHTAQQLMCLTEGAMDFILRPYVPAVAAQKMVRAIKQAKILHEVEAQAIDILKQYRMEMQENKIIGEELVYSLVRAIDAKDEYTNGHSIRVASYGKQIALFSGKTMEYANRVYMMGLLHDVGKIGIPDNVLLKTTELTDEEYDIIKQHPVIGHGILSDIPHMPDINYGARWHHERYDGLGYPDGLKGAEIPEEARILSVADSYDAMTSIRTYRKSKGSKYAISELNKNLGTQFDPYFGRKMIELVENNLLMSTDTMQYAD